MATANRKLDPRKQKQASIPNRFFIFHASQRGFQLINPSPAVVVGNGDAVDSSLHEIEQPFLRSSPFKGGLIGPRFAIVGGFWRVGVEVKLPPTRTGEWPFRSIHFILQLDDYLISIPSNRKEFYSLRDKNLGALLDVGHCPCLFGTKFPIQV